jgi:hypothetical protein
MYVSEKPSLAIFRRERVRTESNVVCICFRLLYYNAKIYATEEEARAQQRDVEPLING